MLRKNHSGFFLLEVLLSLSALFMICLFLLPLLSDLNNQTIRLEINRKAEQLLFEELQANLATGETNAGYSILQRGIEYKIYWRNSVTANQKEVCVKVEKNSFLPETEICRIPE